MVIHPQNPLFHPQQLLLQCPWRRRLACLSSPNTEPGPYLSLALSGRLAHFPPLTHLGPEGQSVTLPRGGGIDRWAVVQKIAKNCKKNCEKLRWFSNRKSEKDLAVFFGFRHPEKIMRLCPWENPMKTQLEKNLHTIQSTMRLAWTIGKHSSGHRRRMQCAFANSPPVSVPHHCYH